MKGRMAKSYGDWGPKDANPLGPQVAGSICPLTKPGFFRYPKGPPTPP